MRYVVKYKVRKMTESLLKHHCNCPVLLMRTTKTAVCLQTKAIFHGGIYHPKMIYWLGELNIKCRFGYLGIFPLSQGILPSEKKKQVKQELVLETLTK